MLNPYDFESDIDYQEYLDEVEEIRQKEIEYEENYYDFYEDDLR